MATYIVDIGSCGQGYYNEVCLFCANIGQSEKSFVVYKETISQMLAMFSTEPSIFATEIYLLPQWVSLIFVPTDHLTHLEAAKERFRHAVRAMAIELYSRIVLGGMVVRPTLGSLYMVNAVTTLSLQFSIVLNSEIL